MVIFLAFVLATSQSASQPVQLKRTFTKGLKSEYSVDANLQIEERRGLLATFLPEELELKYTFFTNTLEVASSIATIRYSRPSLTEIAGPTTDSDPIPKTEKMGEIVTMQLSPINEILDFKDQTPKKKKPSGDSDSVVTAAGAAVLAQESILDFVGPFIGDLERLSVFVGGANGSLDLEPRLNLDAVKVGDTWKRTVSYQPQKLGAKAGKMAVQRLDLVYTYGGPMQSRGKSIQRIHAALKLDTDLGKYVNDLFDAQPENTGLKSIPTKMDIQMDFDLDVNTLQTLYATVKSTGSFKIFGTVGQGAAIEQNIHGESVMKLVSNKKVSATPTKN